MKTEALVVTLDRSDQLEDFSRRVVDAFGDSMQSLWLVAGEPLVRQGRRSGLLYFIVSGELKLVRKDDEGHEVELERLGPGRFLGERELLTGGVRTVSVIAVADSHIRLLPRAELMRLRRDANEAGDVLPLIEQRLLQQRIANALRSLFPRLERDVLADLMGALDLTTLNAGEALFLQDSIGDNMFVVVSGRLSIRLDDGPNKTGTAGRVLGDVSRGDIIGEFALFSPSPRSATVVATRDAELLRLRRADFERLSLIHPSLILSLTRKMVDRVRQTNLRTGPDPELRTMTLTLLPVAGEASTVRFAAALADALARFGTATVLTASEFDRRYGAAGSAQTAVTELLHPMVVSGLSDVESEYRFVLLVADETVSEWTRRCLRGSDRVVAVVDATGDPRVNRLEQAALEVAVEARHELVLLQPDGLRAPHGTAQWLDLRAVAGHYHVETGNPEHIARVARRLSGRAIGLVLSGGGARGYAHLGVWRALEELNVSVDYIGGTSMGALLAAAFSMGHTYEQVREESHTLANPKTLFDYTVPFAALMASRKLNRLCHRIYGDLQIEDLWVPFFSVATNLSTAEQVVYRRGPLWRAVRCSISIPGVFAPVVEGGQVIVDGAVMNNFPVDLMRENCESERVIAVNVSIPTDVRAEYDFNYEVSGWRLLLNRLNPLARRRLSFPAIINTLVRTMEVNSVRMTRHNRSEAQLLLEPNVRAVGLLEFDRFQQASDLGYAHSLEAIRGWLADDGPAEQLRVELSSAQVGL